MRSPSPIPNSIPAEPDEFMKGVIAVLQRRNLRQERQGRDRPAVVFEGWERDHRVAYRSEGPQRSRHVPRVSHNKRRTHPGLTQDGRRKRRVLEGVARPLLAPPHRDAKILFERLAHQRRQRRLWAVRWAAAYQDRQPEPTLLSCRPGERQQDEQVWRYQGRIGEPRHDLPYSRYRLVERGNPIAAQAVVEHRRLARKSKLQTTQRARIGGGNAPSLASP